MDVSHLLLACAAVFLAVVSQLLTGFGFAMVLIPLLMLRIPPAEAVMVSAMLGAVLTLIQAIRDREHIDRPMASSLLTWSLIGLPIGVLVLKWLPAAILKWVVILAVFAALYVVVRGLAIPRSRLSSALTGLISGTLLTSTGINGPPVVAFVRTLPGTVRQYRATIATIFCVQGWLGVFLFAVSGQLERHTLGLAGVGLLVMPVGIFVGEHLFQYVNPQRLRWGIIGMLVLCLGFLMFR